MPPPSPTPEIYRPLVNKAVDANETGNKEEARKIYQEIIAKDPQSAEADFCRAEIALMDDKYEEAVELFTAALKKNPRLETAYNDRGNAYRRLDKTDLAISDYSTAMLLGPGPVHWVCRSRSYLKQKEYFKAMQDATTAINKNRNYDNAYEARGEAWVGLNNPAAAKVDFDKAIEVTKDKPSYLFSRGWFYLKQSKPLEARRDFLAAIEAKPDEGDNYYWLGEAEIDLDNLDGAEKAFTKYRDLCAKANQKDDVNTANNWLDQVRTNKYDLSHKPLDPKYQWATACSAQLFSQNDCGLWSLSGEEPTEKNIADEKRLLQEWWSISSRSELLDALNSQLNDGHNSAWMSYRRMINQNNPGDFAKTLVKAAANPPEVGSRTDLVLEYGNKFGERGILAWDLCRYICLCRWGYKVGWLSEEEAYERIMPVARRLQSTYGSWKQMGEEYLVGRNFWSTKHYEQDKEKTDRILKELLSKPNSPWVKLPWNLNLN